MIASEERKETGKAKSLDEHAASCACGIVHEEGVEEALARAPAPSTVFGLAELFKVFGDPTRLRILAALAAAELCVCDLGATLGTSQSAVSHQLAILRAARLVRYRREGKIVYYSLADDHVGEILRVGLDHVTEGKAP